MNMNDVENVKNECGESTAVDVSEWLDKIDETTCSLDVSNLSLSDAQGEAIINELPPSTVRLEIGGNGFGPKTCRALAALLLESNSSLQYLSLNENPLTSFGTSTECFFELAKSLEVNTTLQTLSLYGCNLGREGGVALAKAVANNKTLTCIKIGYNNFAECDVLSMENVLTSNRKLFHEQQKKEEEAKKLEHETAMLQMKAQQDIEKENDTLRWLADEQHKRAENRRLELKRRLEEEQKQEEYRQRMEQIKLMEEERIAGSKKKKKGKGKKGKKNKKK